MVVYFGKWFGEWEWGGLGIVNLGKLCKGVFLIGGFLGSKGLVLLGSYIEYVLKLFFLDIEGGIFMF